MPGLKRAGRPKPCPAAGCAFVGPYRTLLIHWRSFHDPQVLLYLCPLPGCKFQTPKPHGLRQHWEGRHSASRQQSLQLRTLPLLANFVHNQHRRDPGCCVAPVPPVQRPLGSLPHSSKSDLLVQVKGILGEHKQERAPTPAPTSLVVPPCPGLQTGSVKEEDQQMVVETPREASTRDKCTTVTTPGVVPPTPAIMGFSVGQLNLTKLVSSPALPDSPILIQSSPSYELSLSTSPVSPAFTTLSTPTLPILMSSPALPPVSSPSSDRDPVLAQGSPRPLEPPPLTRILLDEYVPSTPSAILPASIDVPPVSSSVTTAPPEVPATDRETLVSRLQDVDGRRARLDLERIGILQELATRESEELLNTRQQLQEMQQRCQLLESQLMRLRSSSFPTAEVVGDLESICTSHALLLLPNRGQTTVYHLTQRDLVNLDVKERDPALSCERLWNILGNRKLFDFSLVLSCWYLDSAAGLRDTDQYGKMNYYELLCCLCGYYDLETGHKGMFFVGCQLQLVVTWYCCCRSDRVLVKRKLVFSFYLVGVECNGGPFWQAVLSYVRFVHHNFSLRNTTFSWCIFGWSFGH